VATTARVGYSVVVPPMGTFVRQGSVRLTYPPGAPKKWMVTRIGDLEPSTSGWHRASDRIDAPRGRGVAKFWGLHTICGRSIAFAPTDPRDEPGWDLLPVPAVRFVIETADFPAGRVCSRCMRTG
jgi:hypothetical protein